MKTGKIVAIVQARMGSERLPGKILKEVMGRPLLDYLIERLNRSKQIDSVVVATTTNRLDDVVEKYCIAGKINCYRGPENDVLARYYKASIKFKADYIIRICADSPLIDPLILDRMAQLFFKGKCDYLSNTINQTYPFGMNLEVFSWRALKNAYLNARQPYEREHVTPYVYMNPEVFNICQEHLKEDYSFLRLTVDEKEDFTLIKHIIERLYPSNQNFGLRDIIKEHRRDPDLFLINSNVIQRTISTYADETDITDLATRD